MDKGVIVRTAALIIVLLNTILTLFGVPFVIPEEASEYVASIILIGFGLYASVKDGFFKKKNKDGNESK